MAVRVLIPLEPFEDVIAIRITGLCQCRGSALAALAGPAKEQQGRVLVVADRIDDLLDEVRICSTTREPNPFDQHRLFSDRIQDGNTDELPFRRRAHIDQRRAGFILENVPGPLNRNVVLVARHGFSPQNRPVSSAIQQKSRVYGKFLHKRKGKLLPSLVLHGIRGREFDTAGPHFVARRGKRTVQVNRPARIFQDRNPVPQFRGIDRREPNTKIRCKARHDQLVYAARPQVSVQTRWRPVVVFEEGGIGIDMQSVAFAYDQIRAVGGQVGMERGAVGADDAMVGPQDLGAVGGFCHAERFAAFVAGCKGKVARRMPVLGQDPNRKIGHQPVDKRHDPVAFGYGKGAAGAEIVLDVDGDEGRGLVGHGGIPFRQWFSRIAGLIATAFAMLIFLPGNALAHTSERGFVMLLPTELYILGGGLSVAGTILALSLLSPERVAAFFGRDAVIANIPRTGVGGVVAALSFIVFAFLVLCGFFGSPDPLRNPLPNAIWIVGWIIITIAHTLFGNLWAALNPWRFPLYLARKRGLGPAGGPAAFPDRLKYLPAVVLFFAIAWFELVDPAPADPTRLALAVTFYWAVNFLGGLWYGDDWFRYAEPISIYYRYLSLLAPISRDENGWVSLHWPGRRIISHDPVPWLAAAFLILTLATVSFDGLKPTFAWLSAIGVNPLEFPGRTAVMTPNTLGLLGSWLVLGGLFCVTILVGFHRAGKGDWGRDHWAVSDWQQGVRLLVLSLLPISLAYHATHYMTVFLVDIQWTAVSLGDPLGWGANIGGLSDLHVTASFLNTHHGVAAIWAAQVAIIVLGHMLATAIAHAQAHRIFADDGRAATIALMPIGLFMVFYTMLGLWLLSSPTAG